MSKVFSRFFYENKHGRNVVWSHQPLENTLLTSAFWKNEKWTPPDEEIWMFPEWRACTWWRCIHMALHLSPVLDKNDEDNENKKIQLYHCIYDHDHSHHSHNRYKDNCNVLAGANGCDFCEHISPNHMQYGDIYKGHYKLDGVWYSLEFVCTKRSHWYYQQDVVPEIKNVNEYNFQ